MLSCPAIQHRRLRRSNSFPGRNRLPNEGINRLGEGRAGLVRGDIEQADRLFGGLLRGLPHDFHLFALPPDTSQSQARQLIAAQAGEEPGDGQRPHEFEGIELPARVGR